MSSQQSLQTISEIKDAVYYLLDRLNALSLQVSENTEAIINKHFNIRWGFVIAVWNNTV